MKVPAYCALWWVFALWAWAGLLGWVVRVVDSHSCPYMMGVGLYSCVYFAFLDGVAVFVVGFLVFRASFVGLSGSGCWVGHCIMGCMAIAGLNIVVHEAVGWVCSCGWLGYFVWG